MATERQRLTFISYSRINKDFALELAKELRESGFNIWFDLLDIPTGSRWDDQIEKALERCDIFMVILTPSSTISDNVKDEIGYAIDSNKRILPILLKDANVPLRLRRFQYVDFTDISYNEGIDRAKLLLRRLMDEPTEPIPPPGMTEVQSPQPEVDRSAELKADANRLARQRAEAIRRARELEQRGRIQQSTPKIEAIEKKPSSPQTQRQSSPRLFPIIAGIILMALLCLGGGYFAWKNFPPRTPTITELPPTSTPSYTPNIPPPTNTPSITPSPTIQIIDPVQTVKNYWNYRSIKRYDMAWNILSQSFQQRNHNGKLEDYLASRNDDNYCKIDTDNGVVKSNNGSNAVIFITVKFYIGACPGTEALHNYEVTLIFDTESQSWRFDRNVEIK